MSIALGENLTKYRKKAGLSQEELADKLGISRQAVSKWERGEASPDTDNLIALAKFYNVTLDELVNCEPKEDSKESKKESKGNYVHIGPDGIHIKDDEDEVHIDSNSVQSFVEEGKKVMHNDKDYAVIKDKFYLAKKISTSILYPLVILTYLLLGFLLKSQNGWAIYWTLFFIPEIVNSIIDCIHFKRFKHFNIVFAVCFVYLFIGMYMGIWHPTWVIFIGIPIYYTSVWPIDYYLANRDRKRRENENVVEAKVEIK